MRQWLIQLGLSLLAALLCGALVFVVVRGVGGAQTLARSQDLAREVTGALAGGLEGLAGTDLRARRQAIQALDQQNRQLALSLGFGVAALAAVASYLWLERRASEEQAHAHDR